MVKPIFNIREYATFCLKSLKPNDFANIRQARLFLVPINFHKTLRQDIDNNSSRNKLIRKIKRGT